MSFLDRSERLSRLDDLGDLSKKEKLVESLETRLGGPEANLIISNDSIKSFTNHPVNPGFSFGTRESYIRTGDILNFNKEFYKLKFSNGLEQINPLANTTASTVTDPIPTIIPSISNNIRSFLSKDYLEIIKKLKSLGKL